LVRNRSKLLTTYYSLLTKFMEVIPVINQPDLERVTRTLAALERFLPAGQRVHLDVADARFTFHKSWSDADLWPKLRSPYALEVHLMAEEPEKLAAEWLKAGAKRIIVHYETLRDPKMHHHSFRPEKVFGEILSAVRAAGAELMLAVNPETPVESIRPLLADVSGFLVLAVHPGLAGQSFLPIVFDKIRLLRRERPDAKITVDGGVNAELARKVREAGADAVTSASYILENGDPASAYQELSQA